MGPVKVGTSTVLLTGVVSRTHLLYAASWLREQERRGRTVGHVVVRAPRAFLGRARVTPQDCVTLLSSATCAPVHVGDVSDVGGGRASRRAGDPLTLLCIGAPALRQIVPASRAARRVPHIVVVDEGIGSYGDRATRTAAYRRNQASPVWAAVRGAAVSLGHRVLTGEEWSTYLRTPSGWAVNEPVAEEFRRRVSGEPPPAGTAVLLTQPWPDLGAMSEPAYRAHVERVARECARVGLSLTIRPHPADSVERYRGMAVASADVPAELDRAVIEADVVLGAASTALLNLAAFYGTRCLRVRPEELEVLDARLSARQAGILDAFLPPSRLPAELPDALS